MLSMRLKNGTPRNSEWRCCFCLHVRTATIILGIWHLILHVLALSVLAVLFLNPNMLKDLSPDDNRSDIDPFLFNSWGNANDNRPYYLPQKDHAIYYPDLDLGAIVTICTLAITHILIYGAIKGKPTYILPFFCMQMFDFAITTLTATGYLCYLRSVHRLVAENWHLPWRRQLLQLSPECLSLLVLVVFVVSMAIKGYCIGIVFRCYKFLTFRQQAMRSTIHYIMPGEDRHPEPDYSSLLPDYEAACAQAMKQPPPPSYQAAIAAQQAAVTELPGTVPSEPTAVVVTAPNQSNPTTTPPPPPPPTNTSSA